ncbi:MAG: hypothetical protein QW073_02700 [Desulfurococcaceae archaeon]
MKNRFGLLMEKHVLLVTLVLIVLMGIVFTIFLRGRVPQTMFIDNAEYETIFLDYGKNGFSAIESMNKHDFIPINYLYLDIGVNYLYRKHVSGIDSLDVHSPFQLSLNELVTLRKLLARATGGEPYLLINIVSNINSSEWVVTNIRVYYRVSGSGYYTFYGFVFDKDTLLKGRSFRYVLKNEPVFVVSPVYYDSFVPINLPDANETMLLKKYCNTCLVLTLISDSEVSSIDIYRVLVTYEKRPYVYPSQFKIRNDVLMRQLVLYVTTVFIVPILIITYTIVKYRGVNRVSGKTILTYLLLIIVTRAYLLPTTGHSFDMELWKSFTRSYFENGRVYLELWPTTPIFMYILLISYSFYALFRILGLRDFRFEGFTFFFYEGIFIKLPMVLADMATFYALLKIFSAREGSDGKALTYASMYVFNPFIIIISSAWGMYDPLAICFMIWSIYFYYVENRRFTALFLGILSGLTKLFGFLSLIPLVASTIRKRNYSFLITTTGLTLGLALLVYLPILTQGVFEAHYAHFYRRIFLRDDVTIAGIGLARFNLSGLTYPWIYVGLMSLAIMLYIFKLSLNTGNLFKLLIAILVIHYLCYKLVYIQHTSWLIPILLINSFIESHNKRAIYELLVVLVLIGIASQIYIWSSTTIGYLVLGVRSDGSKYLVLDAAGRSYLYLLVASSLFNLVPVKYLRIIPSNVRVALLTALYIITYVVMCKCI